MRVFVAGAFHPLPYTLGGRVRLLRPLAVGGMAEVFVAELLGARGFRRQIVAKRIRPDLAGRARSAEMFEREATVLAGLQHEHIVDVIDFTELEGEPWLLLEQVDGPSVRQLLARHRRLPVDVVTRIVADTARALDALHGAVDAHGEPLGLVHRDLSPDNLVVTGRGVVKLLDFGIVKGEHSPSLTTVGALKGKLVYMAPEQLTGGAIDARTDLWALGVTAYEMLAGVRPFVADSDLLVMDGIVNTTPRRLMDIAPVPRALSDLVGWLLEKDPAHRPGSARLVADLLDRDRERRGPLLALAADHAADKPDRNDDEATRKAVRIQTASLSRAVPPRPVGNDSGDRDDDSDLELTMRRLRPSPTSDATRAARPVLASATGSVTPEGQPGWWSLVASLVDDDVVEIDERSGVAARVPLVRPSASEPTLTVRGHPRSPAPPLAPPAPSTTPPASGRRAGLFLGAMAGVAVTFSAVLVIATKPPPPPVVALPVVAPTPAPAPPPRPVAPPPAPDPTPAPTPSPAPTPATTTTTRAPVRSGRLTVLAVPFAEVFLDGRSIGVTPIDGRRIDAGRHRLRLVGPGGDVDREVTVQPGKTATVRVAMP